MDPSSSSSVGVIHSLIASVKSFPSLRETTSLTTLYDATGLDAFDALRLFSFPSSSL